MKEKKEFTIRISVEEGDGVKEEAVFMEIKKAAKEILERHNCKMTEAYIYTKL